MFRVGPPGIYFRFTYVGVYNFVAGWIHFTLVGISLPTMKLKV